MSRIDELDVSTPTQDVSNQAATIPATDSRPRDLRLFALKSGIVVGLITAAIIIVGSLLVLKIDETIDRTAYNIRMQLAPIANARIGGAQFWSKIESALEHVAGASNELPPERQQKLLANIKTIANRVRPFVAELAPIFSSFRQAGDRTAAQDCK